MKKDLPVRFTVRLSESEKSILDAFSAQEERSNNISIRLAIRSLKDYEMIVYTYKNQLEAKNSY